MYVSPQRCTWCEKTTYKWAVLRECGQELVQFFWFELPSVESALLYFNSQLCGNSGLFKKIVHADIALSASCKKCWTVDFIEASDGLRAAYRYTDCMNLLFPFHYKTLWSICVSGCMWYGGSQMAQTLGHMRTNWLLIMHGWPRHSSQALQGALSEEQMSPFAA